MLSQALQASRMADALLIADLAGREELSRVQQVYMKKQPSPYMRVVKAIQANEFVSKCLLIMQPCPCLPTPKSLQ